MSRLPEQVHDVLGEKLVGRGKEQRPHVLLVKRVEARSAMAEDAVPVLHQSLDHLQQRAALITGRLAVGAFLDPSVEVQQARQVAVRLLKLARDRPRSAVPDKFAVHTDHRQHLCSGPRQKQL